MTERKPMGLTFESFVDRQIDAAKARGEFDHLPGHGEPLPGIDGRYDPDWWLKEKLAREKLDITPQTIVSRRTVEDWMESFLGLKTEAVVRQQAESLNKMIVAANNTDLGPHLPQALLDIDALIDRWRQENDSAE